jgi:WD40 repeat protein
VSVDAGGAGYDVFISYSQAADGRLAPALQDGLARLGKPWYRRRALRVYRDKTGLSANPDLWSAIQAALDRCRWFVLLASPAAAGSRWVNQEIDHWRSTHGDERILVAVTDGDWAWADEADEFDWDRSSAIPAALAGAFAREPLVVDLRWARDETEFDARHGAFRDAVADLAAAVHGRPKDDLVGEDIRQHRRAVRLAWSAAGVLAVLALVASLAGVVAVRNADRAEDRRREAVSRQLAASAAAETEDRIDRALLLAAEAWREDETTEARSTLLASLQASPRFVGALWPDTDGAARVAAVAFSPNGRQVAGAVRRFETDLGAERSAVPEGRFDQIVVWDAATGVEQWATELDDQVSLGIAFVAEDVLLVQTNWSGPVRVDRDGTTPLGPATEVAAGGTRLLASDGQVVSLLDPASGKALASVPGAAPLDACSEVPPVCSVIRPDGGLVLLDARTGEEQGRYAGGFEPETTYDVLLGEDRVVTVDEQGGVRSWGLEGTADTVPVPRPSEGYDDLTVAVSADGSTLATQVDGRVAVWDLPAGRLRQAFTALDGELVLASDGGRMLATGFQQGAAVYDTSSGEVLDAEPRPSSLPSAPRPGDDVVVTFDFQSLTGLAVWDLAPCARGGRQAGDQLLEQPPPGCTAGRRDGVEFGAVSDVRWDPEGEYLLSFGEELLYWDLRFELTRPVPLEGHPGGTVWDVSVSHDGKRFAAVGAEPVVTLWEPQRVIAPGETVSDGPHGVLASFDPSTGLVARVEGGELVVGPLDAPEDQEALFALDVPAVESSSLDSPGLELVLVPGGRRLLSVELGEATLWDLEAGAPVEGAVDCGGRNDEVVTASPDGRHLVAFEQAGVEDVVRICDAETGQVTARVPAPPLGNRFASGSAAEVAPGGDRVAIGGEEGDVWVATLDGDRQARTQVGSGDPVRDSVRALAWSPDGRRLAIATASGEVTVWAPGEGADATEPVPVQQAVDALAFSPDGQRLAVAGPVVEAAELTVWDLASGTPLGEPMTGSLVDPFRLWFTEDGAELVGVDSSGHVDVWSVDVEDWVARACALAGRSLSADERDRYLDGGEPAGC